MIKLPIVSPGAENVEYLNNLVVVSRISSFLCNQWLHLVVNHLMYHKFIHAVPVNRICVVMRCLEIDMGKSRETAFDLAVQRDFQFQFLESTLRHKFY